MWTLFSSSIFKVEIEFLVIILFDDLETNPYSDFAWNLNNDQQSRPSVHGDVDLAETDCIGS